jgi:hypothetical protein
MQFILTCTFLKNVDIIPSFYAVDIKPECGLTFIF